MRLIPWLHPKPKLIPPEEQPAPFGRFTRGVFKGWPCPDLSEPLENVRAQQPDKPDTQPRPKCCAHCGNRWSPDTRGYCEYCGAPLACAAWPPHSQEARAAASGRTRTK